ncbi:MAG: AmmeMemoRadiSam system protein B [Candidatus Muirbacterium halophilum]|nr:AmmeMemoRadiSam system protein B [Candidatus Muirbacterium halophilum]MCK9475662.1 AmmeMemoRadiSam system protein B [Candidatus Muirbacterium halophilum]
MIRFSSFSGQFYEDTEYKLKKQVSDLFFDFKTNEKRKVHGIIAPHAGYIFSGKVASATFSKINIELYNNPLFVLLGPNHSGKGSAVSVSDAESWHNPLGIVNINKKIIELLKKDSFFDIEPLAHKFEHSLEVQIPFIQHIMKNKNFEILPITLALYKFSELKNFSDRLNKALLSHSGDIIYIISTDFSHYVSQEEALLKDNIAIENILNKNSEKLFNDVLEHDISMCGISPVTAYLNIIEDNKKIYGEKIIYQTSGDIMPMNEVVGYAGIVFYRED